MIVCFQKLFILVLIKCYIWIIILVSVSNRTNLFVIIFCEKLINCNSTKDYLELFDRLRDKADFGTSVVERLESTRQGFLVRCSRFFHFMCFALLECVLDWRHRKFCFGGVWLICRSTVNFLGRARYHRERVTLKLPNVTNPKISKG